MFFTLKVERLIARMIIYKHATCKGGGGKGWPHQAVGSD